MLDAHCANIRINQEKVDKNGYVEVAILAIILRGRRRRQHSRNAKRCYQSLDDDGRRKQDRRILRIALVEPKISAWRRNLSSGNDQSLITTTGLDFSVFGELKGRFEAMYSKYSLVSGRRRLINNKSIPRTTVHRYCPEDLLRDSNILTPRMSI